MAHFREGAEARSEGSSQLRHREEQAIVSRSTSQHAPEAFAEIELGPVTGQAIQP